MTTRSPSRRGELVMSLGLLALGAYVLLEIRNLGHAEGYEQLGPRLFPLIIGIGLVLCGAVLGFHTMSGGWRNMPEDQEVHARPDKFAFVTVGLALLLHMALIGSIGFVFAGTMLYVVVARGFGNRQWWKNALIGALLSAAAYYIFTIGLGLHLPASPLKVF